jgi:transposase InsO family protein
MGYLLSKLAITQANQVWALDTTYIPMAQGFVYLTAVVDVASRRVLSHKVAITLEACRKRPVSTVFTSVAPGYFPAPLIPGHAQQRSICRVAIKLVRIEILSCPTQKLADFFAF